MGEGRFAVTYRARDVVFGRPVALKVLRQEYANQTSLTRLGWEASAATVVDHPNTVQIFDYGVHEGRGYLVVEFVAGRNLKQIVEEEGPLAPADAAMIARQLLSGLNAIHAAGIVHGNVKPQNVLVGDDGVVRVADFGISLGLTGGRLTGHGIAASTIAYLAPEQIRGDSVSVATDLYAVGLVLFELLTGRALLEVDQPEEILRAHIHQLPPPVSALADGIPPTLNAVILRALTKDPEDRYASATDMANALDAEMPPVATCRYRLGYPALDSDWARALVLAVVVLVVLGALLAATIGDGSEVRSENKTRLTEEQSASRGVLRNLSLKPAVTATARVIKSPVPTESLPTPTIKPRPSPTPPPPIEPTKVVAAIHQEQAAPTALRFGAADWQGGYFQGDSAWYGRAWTAVYGARSPYPRSSLTFSLATAPSAPATLTITGLDDEWIGNNPIVIVVNGVNIFEASSPFLSWDGVGQGEQAGWSAVKFTVPAGVLQQGVNEIALANQAPFASVGFPPYVLVSDALLEITS